MTIAEPTTELDQRFSSDGATAESWTDTLRCRDEAEIFWLASVRTTAGPTSLR